MRSLFHCTSSDASEYTRHVDAMSFLECVYMNTFLRRVHTCITPYAARLATLVGALQRCAVLQCLDAHMHWSRCLSPHVWVAVCCKVLQIVAVLQCVDARAMCLLHCNTDCCTATLIVAPQHCNNQDTTRNVHARVTLPVMGSIKLQVSFAKEPYKRDCIL